MGLPLLRYGTTLPLPKDVSEAFPRGYGALRAAEQQGLRLRGARLCWNWRDAYEDVFAPAVLERIGYGSLPEGRALDVCRAVGTAVGPALAEQHRLLQGAESLILDLRTAGAVCGSATSGTTGKRKRPRSATSSRPPTGPARAGGTSRMSWTTCAP